ncbi:hypothetical protein [Lysinibacillus sp. G4S2]|uniref:hypothetical protein n=1 Tax=Lysinibacillus sp. G4S2 TaxID=3055859 RepID=UPI0025A17B2F|nr:hypothetical protein [Lysinibacillus sp. G4S2]MDM5248514.1 hypothetical protein [Lysinibacillus sp. G4S2]
MFSVRKRSVNVAAATKWLIGRLQEALLRAKAKRQQQSAQSERKSTTRCEFIVSPLATAHQQLIYIKIVNLLIMY